jgi:hypothetical protein
MIVLLLASGLLGFVVGGWVCRFHAEDSCYDSGGAWNSEWGYCERVLAPTPNETGGGS